MSDERDEQCDWDGRERRRVVLSEEQFKRLSEAAAKEVFNTVYREIGQSVAKKLAWALGVIVFGVLVFLGAKGYIK